MARMSSDIYGVIGVGYFGSALARTLAAAGKGVIAIDIDQAKLKDLSPYVSSVYQIESISREALEDAGIGNCATVVIGIGENIESSILATLACIEIGVPRVISKAGSKSHGKILEKLGAEVIFPEFDAGERIAMSLMSKANLDRLPISEEFSIVSLDLNPAFEGKTILDLNWRKKYNINVIAIISGKKTDATILPDTTIPGNARVVLSGSNQDLEKFRNVNAKGMD
ncbi:MAG: TrkA family potassium uptake protein [Spirochaetales bacterium]|nr:TrkA family potassium uptake protein [Spirochaetales bacterium]